MNQTKLEIMPILSSEALLSENKKTRMHSSRMRTAQLFPLCPHMNCSGGVPGSRGTWPRGCTWSWRVYLVPGGAPGQGVYLVPGVYLLGCVPGPGGCTWSWGVYPVMGGIPGPGGYLPVDRNLGTCYSKYYLAPNFVCGQ